MKESNLKKHYGTFEQQAARTAGAIPSTIDWDEVSRLLEENRKKQLDLVSARPTRSRK